MSIAMYSAFDWLRRHVMNFLGNLSGLPHVLSLFRITGEQSNLCALPILTVRAHSAGNSFHSLPT